MQDAVTKPEEEIAMQPEETHQPPIPPSAYLEYLPAIYQDSEFLGRFLRIFEDNLIPAEHILRNIHRYFDPRLTPEGFLPWLASWIDLALDENWPIQKRRELIANGVELYRWRGTRRGLREYLKIYTGVEPEIVEHFAQEEGGPYVFSVIVRVQDPGAINEALVRQVIEAEKPAHTAYNLRIEKARSRKAARPPSGGKTPPAKKPAARPSGKQAPARPAKATDGKAPPPKRPPTPQQPKSGGS